MKSLMDSASLKQVLHFAQLATSGKFQKFDYGEDNIKHYKKNKVPEYDLSLIKVPITIFCGSQDALIPMQVNLGC